MAIRSSSANTSATAAHSKAFSEDAGVTLTTKREDGSPESGVTKTAIQRGFSEVTSGSAARKAERVTSRVSGNNFALRLHYAGAFMHDGLE